MSELKIIVVSKGMALSDSMKEDANLEFQKFSKFLSFLHRIEVFYHFEHEKFFAHLHLYGHHLNLEAKSGEHQNLHTSLHQAVEKASRQIAKVHELK